MSEITRALIVVKPKQPFLDWSQSIDFDEDLTLEEMRKDSTASRFDDLTLLGVEFVLR